MDSEVVAELLRQILAEATALKHVGSRTTKPYAVSIADKAEQALTEMDTAEDSPAVSRLRPK
jgi:hypothetical protein